MDYVFEVASGVGLTVRRLGIVNVSLDLPVEQQAGGGIRGGYFGSGNPWATRLVLEDFLLDTSTDLFESIHLRGSLSSTRATFRNAIRRTPTTRGQAIRIMGPSTTIRDSEFLNNSQPLSVGGPDGASEVPLRISDTRFVGGGVVDIYCPIDICTDAGVLQRVSISGFSAPPGLGWAVLCSSLNTLVIRESSFFNNASAGISAGYPRFPSRIDIHNSTIEGSGIFVDVRGMLKLSNSTVTAAPGGYALDVSQGSVESINSVVVGACRLQLVSVIQTGGANFESPGDTCFPHSGLNFANLTSEQLGLGPLSDNGGPTPTRLPSPQSVLLDHTAGTAALCETIDQRGFVRPRPCTAGAADPLAIDDAIFIDGLDL